MTNEVLSLKPKIYDLEERTGKFGEALIGFTKTLPATIILEPLIRQVIRSGTSIAANYMEADATITKKDFKYKISLCRKEAKETKYWLRMIRTADPDQISTCQVLAQGAQESTLIFSAILKS